MISILFSIFFIAQTPVIVDGRGSGASHEAPKVFVEPGTETIAGTPEASLRAAHRTWEHACTKWKNEMRRLNGRSLIQVSCGVPKRSEEVNQGQRIYVYKSAAKFKVRVIGK